VETLLQDLSSDDASVRESAVARLAVIGSRAVGRLQELLNAPATHTPLARTAALRALEAIGNQQSLDVAARALDDTDARVAVAAVGVLRAFVRSAQGARAIEALMGVAVDRRRADAIRLAALDALRLLDAASLKPLFTLLRDDPSEALRMAVRGTSRPRLAGGGLLKAAAEGKVVDDPAEIHRAIVDAGDSVPLSMLRDVIERLRERETADPASAREWMVARAAAHSVLAHRGSRIAFYDLRETLQASSGPLPVEFLNALGLLGDASCLEAIAAAHARASGESWWRQQLSDAFRAIVARERITRRNPLMKKIEKRWGDGIGATMARSKRTAGR
jgi:hypothetical protein